MIMLNDDTNIIIVGLDITKTSDRMLSECLRIYCCKWTSASSTFHKFQVGFVILEALRSRWISRNNKC